MAIWKSKIFRVIVFVVVFPLCGGGIISYISFKSDIIITAMKLRNIWVGWNEYWRPDIPKIIKKDEQESGLFLAILEDRIIIGGDRFLEVNTNLYKIGANKWHGLFEYHVGRLESHGYFVIAKEGEILWASKSGKLKLIDTQR